MPVKPYFKTAFGNQAVRSRKHCLNLPRHYYYPIFPWVWDKLSWKKSALVRSKILGLFVNRLTAEYTYSRRNMQDFDATSSDAIIFKTKDFFLIFYYLSEIYIKWSTFWKKKESSSLIISENYWLQKRGLLKCLKSLTLEQLSVINLLTSTKHCLNLHGTTIILFFRESGINLSWKKSALVRSKILGLFV